jgi:hypothetical protein
MTDALGPVRLSDGSDAGRRRYRVALALVLVALFLWNGWAWYRQSDAYQESHGAANLARPSVADCAIARAIVADVHGTGRERQLLRMFGDAKLSLQTFAWGWEKSAAPPAGYLITGSDGDWRWCAGLGSYVRSVGWVGLGDVLHQRSAMFISKPAYNAARNEAIVFENALPDPRAANGFAGPDRRSAFGGDLVFLKNDQRTGAWGIVGHSPAN